MTRADPFAELKSSARRISPRMLRGKKKEIWLNFAEKYHNEDYTGLSMRQLYAWAKKHCALTCSVSCFRQALLDQNET